MRIFPLGDNALTVEFGNEISPETNRKAIALGNAISQESFHGLIETLPAYSGLTVYYTPPEVRRFHPTFDTAFEAVKAFVERSLENVTVLAKEDGSTIEIPVSFADDAALDLKEVSTLKGVSPDEYIDIFLSQCYRVYMIGFLPGFAYMGEVDERIAVPRKATPRLEVPKGSVGIAGSQTGIYPTTSPGGWQIIGRTSVEMFTPDGVTPCHLQAGDTVRFVRE